MTLATLAPVSGNQTGIWIVLALVVVFGIVAVLWQHEVTSDRHDDTLARHHQQLAELAYQMPALLEYLGIEISEPVADDSPEAMEAESRTQAAEPIGPYDFEPDDAPTDVFPAVQPETVPMALLVDPTPAVQARRDAAWDARRPSPVPRKSAEWVDEAKKRFDFSGRDR